MALVTFLPRAERDLLELPAPQQQEILSQDELLQALPYLGGSMEGAYQGYRYLLVGRKNRFRLIYKVVHDDLVEVAYIRHCRRQLGLRPMDS